MGKIVSMRKRTDAADEAAEVFYGQNEASFLKQVRQICASDPRLIKAFQQTRETYQDQKATRH